MNMKKCLQWMSITLLVFCLGACSAQSNKNTSTAAFPGTPEEGSVTLNITSEPFELNPLRIADAIAQSVLVHCMSGLTKLDENDNPVADLAEKWEINEDMTVYTLYLRKDAVWTNKDPVTAHDFYYSWVTQMIPETGSIIANYLTSNIKNGDRFYQKEVDASELGLKVIDDYTIEIEWNAPKANGLFLLSLPCYLPVNQKAYEEIGDANYAKEADKMVTNGAYRISEWVHDDHITLEKSESYFNADNIQIEKAKLVMVQDYNTAINAFTAGEVDLTSLYSEQIEQVRKSDPNAVKTYNDGGTWFLFFNTEHEYLSNVNLRKALAYSIDVQSLLDYVIKDGSIVADGLVPPIISSRDGGSYAEKRGSLFHYDKEAANEYLELALQELNIDKKDLKLVFWGSDTTYNINQAAYLQQQWESNLGIKIELKSMNYKALQEAEFNGEFTFLVEGWGATENDPLSYLGILKSNNAYNYGRFNNAQYDALVEAASNEVDPKKWQELISQAEQILIDEMAVGPLYFSSSTYAISDKLTGLIRTPFQFFNILNASIKK